jgi:hypothetical protein
MKKKSTEMFADQLGSQDSYSTKWKDQVFLFLFILLLLPIDVRLFVLVGVAITLYLEGSLINTSVRYQLEITYQHRGRCLYAHPLQTKA